MDSGLKQFIRVPARDTRKVWMQQVMDKRWNSFVTMEYANVKLSTKQMVQIRKYLMGSGMES